MGFSRQEHWNGLPFPSPNGTIERKKVTSLSRVQLFATPWTVAYQAPPSMEFSRQEYESGLPFPSPLTVLVNGCLSLGNFDGTVTKCLRLTKGSDDG